MCEWAGLAGIFLVGAWATICAGGWFVVRITDDYTCSSDGEGLDGAGRKIGRLERTLVFVLVLADAPAEIGFLITAKSILRFGDMSGEASGDDGERDSALSRRERSEYVIVGTLASFAWAVSIAYCTKYLLTCVDPVCRLLF